MCVDKISVHVRVCLRVHVRVCVCIYVCAHSMSTTYNVCWQHLGTSVCVSSCAWSSCACACVCVCICVWARACVRVHMCVSTCVCVCAYVCEHTVCPQHIMCVNNILVHVRVCLRVHVRVYVYICVCAHYIICPQHPFSDVSFGSFAHIVYLFDLSLPLCVALSLFLFAPARLESRFECTLVNVRMRVLVWT